MSPWALLGIGVVAAGGYALAGWQRIQLTEEQAAHTQTRLEHSQQENKALVEARADLERILNQQREVSRDDQKRQAQASADVAAAGDAVQRLQQRLAAVRAAALACPAPAGRGAPDADVGDALAACAAEYRLMAADAQRARDAGLSCEARYDALSSPSAAQSSAPISR